MEFWVSLYSSFDFYYSAEFIKPQISNDSFQVLKIHNFLSIEVNYVVCKGNNNKEKQDRIQISFFHPIKITRDLRG